MADIPSWLGETHRVIIQAVGVLCREGCRLADKPAWADERFTCEGGVPFGILNACCVFQCENEATALPYLIQRGVIQKSQSRDVPQGRFLRPGDAREVVSEVVSYGTRLEWSHKVRDLAAGEGSFLDLGVCPLRVQHAPAGRSTLESFDVFTLAALGWEVFDRLEREGRPIHERLRIEQDAQDYAYLDDKKYPLEGAQAALLIELKEAAEKGQRLTEATLREAIGSSPASVVEGLPGPLREIVVKPGRGRRTGYSLRAPTSPT